MAGKSKTGDENSIRRAASKKARVEQTNEPGKLNEMLEKAMVPPTAANMELVFGFVGPTGIDLDTVCNSLQKQLRRLGYEPIVVRLSDLISTFLGKASDFPNEYERIKTLMERGTQLRETTASADIVCRLAIAAIRESRLKTTGDVYKPGRIAYILRSFKRPEEVDLMRSVYGKAFTLVSIYASQTWRTHFLKNAIGPSLGALKSQAEERSVELIKRDYAEEDRKLGQRVGKTFPLADYFVTSESRPELDRQLRRLVQLTFGNPYISPNRDEQSMFFAKAAAVRSLDLSRQVGAAIVSSDGEILASGCNEVPKFGGGLYWGEDQFCDRDFERGSDSNVSIKREIVEDAFERLKQKKLLSVAASKKTSTELAESALFGESGSFKDSLLFDVIEFGRAVHAEMAAIAQAARNGIKTQGTRLFCTTFPCHICARHIVAAGIRDVVFIEPYEKSRTAELYSDSISIEPAEPSAERVNFHAFVGAAPRRYMDFFESSSPKKTAEGTIRNFEDVAFVPRIKRLVLTYTLAEIFVVQQTPPRPSQLQMRSIK